MERSGLCRIADLGGGSNYCNILGGKKYKVGEGDEEITRTNRARLVRGGERMR